MALTAASRLALADGCSMPLVGFGCYQIGADDVARCCRAALSASYPHVDTAEVYKNESGVGDALRGSTPRPFVTSKLWPGNPAWGQTPKTFDAAVGSLSEKKVASTPRLRRAWTVRGPRRRTTRVAAAAKMRRPNPLDRAAAVGYEGVATQVAACEATNKALGFPPDLYLIHGPFSGGPDARLAQWKALVECKKRGLCTSSAAW